MELTTQQRKMAGYYLVWVAFNLILLFVASDGAFDSKNANTGIDDFVPFNLITDSYYSDWGEYDITEFLAYAIIPLLIIGALTALKDSETKPTPQVTTNAMDYRDYLSETPYIKEYPHNVVEVHLQDGRVRHLYVNNSILDGPASGGPLRRLQEVLREYLRNNPEAVEAQIYQVQDRSKRDFVDTVSAA